MKYSNLIIAVIAIALCVSLVFAENLTPAYALSVTSYTNGPSGDNSNGIIKCGSKIITTDSATADINFFSASSPSTHLGELTSGGGFSMGCDSTGTRAYTYTAGGTLQEVDVVNQALLRSLATGCDSVHHYPNKGASTEMLCATTAGTDQVKIINLGSMSITYTSTTLDAGASACDNVNGLWYNSATDTLFASCSNAVQDRLVSVIGFTTSGTPDFNIATTATTPTSVAFNNINSNVFLADASSNSRFYNYSASTGFTAWTTTSSVIGCGTTDCVTFSATSGWYVVLDSNDFLRFFDSETSEQILPVSVTLAGSNQLHFLTSRAIYIGTGNTDFAVVDGIGIEFGEGATGEDGGDGGGGIDCTLPENEQILICRLGDNPDCNGTVLGCAGNFIIGNVTGDTGLTPIICATGIVDCVANPDMKTNGVGYLLVTIALAIIIGILWVASRGDLNSIPTFIWFVATLAVVGAFTLMDLIDATFLVITAIIVIALAAAKVRGLFGGEFR